MKRRTFYHLSLSLPYVALLISGAFTYLTNGFAILSPASPDILSGLLVFFTFSAVLWAPFYTWMVAVLLFWGRGRTNHEIRTLYVLSPAVLAGAMGLPALLVGLPESGMFLLWGFLRMNHLDFAIPLFFENYSLEQFAGIILVWAFMAALSLLIGYLFVGGALLIERGMDRRGFFRGETPSGEQRY